MKIQNDKLEILKKARDTYGPKAQIAVSAEECCELAKELLKYLRYDTHEKAVEKTKQAVVYEVADVMIILDHITHIFDITESELNEALDFKIARLKKWLSVSDSNEYTTELRSLDNSCVGCFWNDHWDDPERAERCATCGR